jgi:hypothetical protein
VASASGLLAIGEIGERAPDVRTVPIDGSGFAIEFTSGMMDFVYAVVRALAGSTIRYNTTGAQNEAPLELSAVATHVAQTFKQWARHTRWPWLWGRIDHPRFPVTDRVRELTEALSTVTELFMLSHELGHVAIHMGLYPSLPKHAEEDADSCGLLCFLPAAEKAVGLRLAIFGAVFAVRIFAGLERLGVRFSSRYPPQIRRVALLRAAIRSRCPTEQHFHEASTLMVAYQDMMDDVETIIDKDKHSVAPPPDGERILVRLIAELEEVGRGRQKQETLREHLIEVATLVPTEMMRQVAETLALFYMSEASGPTYLPRDIRGRMGMQLAGLIPHLPDPLKRMFQGSGTPATNLHP